MALDRRTQPGVEMLESRTHLTAAAALVGATVTPTQLQVVVEYTSDLGISSASLGTGDITIRRDGAAPVTPALTQVVPVDDNLTVRAVYAMSAPGGAWDPTDNGAYITRLMPLQVRESNNAPVPSGDLGSNNLRFTPLEASVQSSTVRTSDWLINVRYSGAGVLLSSLDSGDITVTGPGGYSQQASLYQSQTIGGAVVATYRVTSPGGAWDAMETGVYRVALADGQVRDDTGVAMFGGTISTHSLWFNAPRVNETSAVLGEADLTFRLTYQSTTPIEIGTLDDSDLVVRRVGGSTIPLTLVSASRSGNTAQASYRMAAPGGSWDSSDNAAYELVAQAGSVAATGGGVVPLHTVATRGIWFDPQSASVTGAAVERTTTAGNRWIDVTLRLRRDLLTSEPTVGQVIADITTPAGGTIAAAITEVTHRSVMETSVVVRVMAPDVFFSYLDRGEYGLTVRAGIVRSEGSSQSPTVETEGFEMADLSAPRVEFLAETVDESHLSISLNFRDDGAFDQVWLDRRLPLMSYTMTPTLWEGGPRNKLFDYTTPFTRRPDGSIDVSVATTFPTRGGQAAWSWRNTGDYRLWVLPWVRDTLGNAGGYGEFETRHMEFPYIDATVASTSMIGTDFTVTIAYDARGTLTADSFHSQDVTLVDTNGEVFSLARVAAELQTGGVWHVRYGATLPDNVRGTFGVKLAGAAVTDSVGDTTQDVTLSEVEIAPLTARLSSATRTSSGLYVNVLYQSVSGLNRDTIEGSDISVVERPGMAAGVQSVTTSGSATLVVYRFDPPGGSWDVSDNGTYTLRISAGAVAEQNGWQIDDTVLGSRVFSTFTAPAVDLVANNSNASDWTIDIAYDGVGGINTNTLGNNDLSLTRGTASYTVSLIDVFQQNGRTIGRYRVNPRGAVWSAADNGQYALRLNSGSVSGADGTVAAARTLSTFAAVRA
ncbi:MAG: hypothetical protein ACOYN0_04375 [Phycisphaerales bacterium]